MKKRKKVISVVGARPQFIKLAPLIPKLKKIFNHKLIHTGQHYDKNMSEIFFKQLKLPKPNINFKIGGNSHAVMTAEMMIKLGKYFEKTKPDLVIVYGDTNSTLAGAVVAAKMNIPVAHVEAGLRSFDKSMPEEINRITADHLSALNFYPTKEARMNLLKEGISKNIINSGDLMYELIDSQKYRIKKNNSILKKHNLTAGQYLYITFHRAANTDLRINLQKFYTILTCIKEPMTLVLHPRTKARMISFGIYKNFQKMENLKMIEPVGYLDSLSLAFYSRAVLTDSGGLQKEAVFVGRPVLTLRDETEWVETLSNGNQLVGLSLSKIKKGLKNLPTVRKTKFKVSGKLPSDIIVNNINLFLREK